MHIDKDEKKILNIIRYMPIVFIFILSLMITQIILYKKNENYKNQLEINRALFLENNKNRAKAEIVRIYTQIKTDINNLKNSSTANTDNELKEFFLKRIKKVKIGKTGYVFIYNLDGTCLAHFKDNFIGVNRLEVKDINGNFVVKDVLDFAKKNKQGFMSYIAIMKPGSKVKSREKISYIKLLDEWDWVIGTGFYLDDLDSENYIAKEQLIKSNNEDIEEILYLCALITILISLFSFYFSKYVEIRFLNYKKSLGNQILENEKQEEEFNRFFQLSINLQLISTTDGIIKQLNSASKSILGYENEELINTKFLDFVHPDDINSTIEEVSKLSRGGNVYFFENRYIHKNGHYVNLAWSATTDSSNNLIYATAQDTTSFKKMEIEKDKNEQILFQQSKMAAMGEMLGNIAHQWRQPLSVISTSATGAKLQNELGLLKENDLNEYFDKINNTAQYLSQTIEDFRGFFNPQNRVQKEFKVADAIAKALNLVSAQFITKDIEIIQNIEDCQLEKVENELVQVIINILNNAKDALVQVENQKRLIFINTYKNDNSIVIEIKDNAKGIPENIINRIFEPYFTTKHQSQGTGIGLYMSAQIVKNHLHGVLSASNEVYSYEGVECIGAMFSIKVSI